MRRARGLHDPFGASISFSTSLAISGLVQSEIGPFSSCSEAGVTLDQVVMRWLKLRLQML